MKRVRWLRVADIAAITACALVVAWSFSGAPIGGVTSPNASPDHAAANAETEAELEEGLEGAEENEAEELKKREDWFNYKRTDSKGRLPDRAWLKAQAQAERLRTPLGTATTPLQWSLLGPRPIAKAATAWVYGGSTPYSGRVTSIATHPTDDRIAYMGSALGGVWRTTNSGQNWTEILGSATTSASLSIGAVALDPSHPDTVYVGTGEANFGGWGYLGTGLYRSTNAGQEWVRLNAGAFDGCSISSIVVKPGDPQTVVVGVVSPTDSFGGVCNTSNRYGIWRTENGGTNWNRVFAVHATKIVVAPNDPNVMYAGVYNGGVYKSTNAGAGWTKVAQSSTVLPAPTFGRVEISVVATPNSTTPQQTIYAAYATHGTDLLIGIYRSNDGGATWAKLSAINPWCSNQCNYDLVLAADPRNSNLMIAGGVYLAQYSSNTPKRIAFWTPQSGTTCPLFVTYTTSTVCLHVDFHALTFDASNRLWIGNDGGIWRTSNPGATTPTFTNLNGDLSNIMVYPGIAGGVAGPLLAGAQDNGSSYFNGSEWSLVGGGDGGYQVVAANGSVLVSTWQEGRVHRFVNGTECTYDENPGEVAAAGKVAFIPPLAGNPANANIIFAGTYRVYRATNANSACGLLSWQPYSQYFYYPNTTTPDVLTAIAAGADGKTTYASTVGGRVWVSQNNSTTWTARTTANGLPGREVSDFWVDPANAGIAYAAVEGFDVNGRHLYRTANFGQSWQDVSGNLINSPTNAVTVDTSTSPATIYVGTDNGVFWSNNGGTSWQNTSVGLPRVIINDLVIDKTAKKLIAATHGRGIWTAPLIGATAATPVHNAFASARTVNGVPYTDTGVSTAGTGTETGEPILLPAPCADYTGKTVWYRYSPTTTSTVVADTIGSTFDTVLAVYRGTAITALTAVTCDDDGAGTTSGPSKTRSFKVLAGQTYYFQVGGYRETSGETAASGTLNFKLTAGGPLNDYFVDADAATALPYAATPRSNATATNETSEDRDPDSCAGYLGKTLWYRYTPASGQTVTVDTIGSTFDTFLVAFQGTTLGGLTEVGCDDDGGTAGSGGPSRIPSLVLTGGQTYYFQVGGYIDNIGDAAPSGTVNFRITTVGPSSDMFAGAITISTLPYVDSGRSTANATNEAGEDLDPSCTDFVGKTIWYKYVAGSSGNLKADTIGSSFDTVLTVFRGTTLGGLIEHACDDDSGSGTGGSSQVTFAVTAGQTYYFQVGGWRNLGEPYTGTVTFHLATAP